MKKLVLFAAMILLAGCTSVQTIKKGSLVGVHNMTIELMENVTMDQFLTFLTEKYMPAAEAARPGWKVYLTKSIRGEISNTFGLIMVIESEKERDKYFNPDGTYNEFGIKANQNFMPLWEEMNNKYGKMSSTFTDWLVL